MVFHQLCPIYLPNDPLESPLVWGFSLHHASDWSCRNDHEKIFLNDLPTPNHSYANLRPLLPRNRPLRLPWLRWLIGKTWRLLIINNYNNKSSPWPDRKLCKWSLYGFHLIGDFLGLAYGGSNRMTSRQLTSFAYTQFSIGTGSQWYCQILEQKSISAPWHQPCECTPCCRMMKEALQRSMTVPK